MCLFVCTYMHAVAYQFVQGVQTCISVPTKGRRLNASGSIGCTCGTSRGKYKEGENGQQLKEKP